jgi:hypothetical protein
MKECILERKGTRDSVVPYEFILFGHKRDINLIDDLLKLRVMSLKDLRNHPLTINNEHTHF